MSVNNDKTFNQSPLLIEVKRTSKPDNHSCNNTIKGIWKDSLSHQGEGNPVSLNALFAKIATENLSQIFFSGIYDPEDSLLSNLDALHQLLVSKQISLNIMRVKINWINDEHLDLKSLDNEAFNDAIKYVVRHQLTSANFFQFTELNNNDLKELSANCQQLQRLTIHSSYMSHHISEDQLAQTIGKLVELKDLKLHCSKIKGDVLANALSKLTNLRSLSLSGCRSLSGAKIVKALIQISNLESLDLSFCDQIPNEHLSLILISHTQLLKLKLSWCAHITGHTFTDALKKLTELQSLDLSNSCHIPSENLLASLEPLTNLQYLYLINCDQIKSWHLERIHANLPNLHIQS